MEYLENLASFDVLLGKKIPEAADPDRAIRPGGISREMFYPHVTKESFSLASSSHGHGYALNLVVAASHNARAPWRPALAVSFMA